MNIIEIQDAEALQKIKARSKNTEGSVFRIQRIKGASNYSRTITYHGSTENPTVIVHSGTTSVGSESITETITYVDADGGDFRISTIIYS